MYKKNELSKVSAMTMVLNRVLTYGDIDYIMDNWYGFYLEPIKYNNLNDIINNEIDKLHKSE